MSDPLTPEQRSFNMSRIRSSGSSPEEKLGQLIREVFPRRWIKRRVDLPGKPDFYLPGLRLAVFMDGCFWHQCPRHGRKPQTNQDYWIPKLERNKSGDRRTNAALRGRGIRVRRVWEHNLTGTMAGARRQLLRTARELTEE